MAKTEEQLFLERLGVFEVTATHDDDFEVESSAVDEFAEERKRLEEWEYRLTIEADELATRRQRLDLMGAANMKEAKRLDVLKKELDALETTLAKRESTISSNPEATIMDDAAIDEYRRKKANRLIKSREDAVHAEVPSVWSTAGWNT